MDRASPTKGYPWQFTLGQEFKMNGNQATRFRKRLVVGVYLLVVASGVCGLLWPENGLLGWGLALACASTATLACVVDAQIRGRPLVTSLHFLIFLTWPLAVPLYLVWSRKWRGIVLVLIHGFALGTLSVVLFGLPLYVGYRWAYEGHLALEAGDYGRATTLFNRAVYLRCQDANTWAGLGAALEGSDQVREAAAAYERALALDPDWTDCRTWLFVCKWHLAETAQDEGDSKEAVALYQQAIALDDAKAELWYALGIAQAGCGDVPAAIAAMEKACALDGQNEKYRQGLAALREQTKKEP